MISVRHASKRFGDFDALSDVSLDIPAGSLTALLGPSGSGKSTLLRALAGLETLDSGTVVIDGVDVTGVPPRSRGIGFVFQHYAAFKHMTVRDNVAFGLTIRKRPKDAVRRRVDELLELVGLAGLAGRYPDELSGGQRQRMALARALAVEPSVLLLDEPFGALDATVRAELRAWLRRLHDEVHVTTVLVTHDQAEALEVADRVAVLHRGRVEQVDEPLAVYDRPANAFVMGFIGSVARLGDSLVRPHRIALRRAGEPSLRPTTLLPASSRRSDLDAGAWMGLAPGRASAPPGGCPGVEVGRSDERTGHGHAPDVVTVPATVDRVARLGSETLVELLDESGRRFVARLSRDEADGLALARGDRVEASAPRDPATADFTDYSI